MNEAFVRKNKNILKRHVKVETKHREQHRAKENIIHKAACIKLIGMSNYKEKLLHGNRTLILDVH